MNFKLPAVFLLFLLVVSCAPKQAIKQEEQLIPPTAAEGLILPDIEQKKEMKEEKKPLPEVEKKAEEQYVMLNFENADIETVIATVSEMLKINYILAPGVTGKITIQSYSKVPLSELFKTFQTVLEFNGFTAVKDGSFYRIVPIDTAKQQPLKIDAGKKAEIPKDASFITQQIPLEYVKASDVANIVRNLMPRGTDIIVYEHTNMLIITAPPSGMLKFMKLLETIDIPATERDAIKTFVYNVENGEAKKLAEILKNIFGKQKGDVAPPVKSVAPATPPAPAPAPLRRPVPAAIAPQPGVAVLEGIEGYVEGEVLIDSYDDINALIIKATPRAYLTILETLKRLDTQPKQVLIEVLIAEVSLTDETSLGLEWVLKGKSRAFNKNFDFLAGNAQTPLTFLETKKNEKGEIIEFKTNFVPVVGSGLFANLISTDQFNVLINAAATTGNVNVLASPHILALDNKEAKIEISDEVPVATSISQPQTTTDNTISNVQFKAAGIILTVTPHINEKKQVTLKISQEVSEPGKVYPIRGQDYQGFTTRKVNTTAIVQNGHTLVIGGIITETKGYSRSGIPFLSKIPLFGYLFGTTTDSVRKKELILMVTPHVVSNHEEADLLTAEYMNKVKDLKKKIEKRQKDTQADIHTHKHGEEEKKD